MGTESGPSPPRGFVQLRVGGKRFEASRDVLLSEPGSVFEAMLGGGWAHARGDGGSELIFDRDPRRFRVVLNWLRTREVVLEGGVVAEGARSEAEFFGLAGLADDAARIIDEREGHRCLQAAVDSRRGKLVSLGPGEAASLPTGEPVLVRGPCFVAMSASFEAVGAGIVSEIIVGGTDRGSPEFIVHSYDGGRMLRAVGRVDEGCHHLQLLFRHVGMDDREPRSYVHGPARVEFWRYPSAAIVWMDEAAALSNTAAWYANMHGPPSSPYCVEGSMCRGAGEGGEAEGGLGPSQAQNLANMVGAISACVYR